MNRVPLAVPVTPGSYTPLTGLETVAKQPFFASEASKIF
jgi:hypothetical protein